MEKKELRKYIRSLKKEHGMDELRELSSQMCEQVKKDGAWRAAGTVLLYRSLPDEVDTAELIANAVLMGKKVLLPVIVGDDLELRVYEGEDALAESDSYGIMEPVGKVYPVSEYDKIDLAIIPGMAFDGYCNRLGRGKGYYDRLLPRLQMAWKMGLCFPFQKIDVIPCEEHDIKMNEVVNIL